jgi:enoyl-CoA hydratase/carnithine racemase
MRIASENAQFGFAFCLRGLIPEMGSTFYLSRLVGLGRASELVLTAKTIDAQEAKEIGLVNHVVSHDALMKFSEEMAKGIAQLPPLAVRVAKRTLREGLSHDFATQLHLESYAIDYLRGTQDHEEGARSFLEKREPVFKGK